MTNRGSDQQHIELRYKIECYYYKCRAVADIRNRPKGWLGNAWHNEDTKWFCCKGHMRKWEVIEFGY